MGQILFIRFGKQPGEAVTWVVSGPQGDLQGPVTQGGLSEALSQAQGNRVIILLPGSDVLLTEADIPVRGAARQLQAAPFALEEYIAQDVADMHFAVGKRRNDGKVPVAAIERLRLDAWLSPVRESGCELSAVYSEVQGTPPIPGAISVIVEGETALARFPDGEFLAVETDMLNSVVATAIAPEQEDAQPPVRPVPGIMVYLDQAQQMGKPWLQEFKRTFSGAEFREIADGVMAHLVSGLLNNPGINLLQGEYAPKSDWQKNFKPWRGAAAAVGILILISSLVDATTIWKLSSREADLDQAIETVFRQTFPAIPRIDDPRRQLDQQLLAIRGAGTGASSEFLETVIALGNVVPTLKDSRVEGASFRNRIMSLQIRTPDVPTLDQLKRGMEQQGNFLVSISSANPDTKGIEGRVEISRSAP